MELAGRGTGFTSATILMRWATDCETACQSGFGSPPRFFLLMLYDPDQDPIRHLAGLRLASPHIHSGGIGVGVLAVRMMQPAGRLGLEVHDLDGTPCIAVSFQPKPHDPASVGFDWEQVGHGVLVVKSDERCGFILSRLINARVLFQRSDVMSLNRGLRVFEVHRCFTEDHEVAGPPADEAANRLGADRYRAGCSLCRQAILGELEPEVEQVFAQDTIRRLEGRQQ